MLANPDNQHDYPLATGRRFASKSPLPFSSRLSRYRVVSVALANKLARIAWVVLTRKEAYRPHQLAA
jgi:hypothetical protein